jgi:orotate phosphoribosyltransferase
MANQTLPPHTEAFLAQSISAGALSFGTFTLKSGRISPYFFNAGLFHRATPLRALSSAYAQTLAQSTQADGKSLEYDVLFGPAYKGIPLAATVVDKLASIDEARYGDISYSFNRKEAKDHGEGGNIVGSPLKGKRVVIVDDVITAGTAIREAIDIIQREGGTLVAIIVAFDRQEKATATGDSAIGAVQKEFGIPVLAILTLNNVIEYLKSRASGDDIQRLEQYRKEYGV